MTAAPAMFVAHGSPTFALETQGLASAKLSPYKHRFAQVKAIVLVSAHWQTQSRVLITSSSQPETIHDFGGFEQALYQIQYPAPGAPELAFKIKDLLIGHGIEAELDPSRGLDHGAWVPLMHLAPDAAIPVIQIGLPYFATSEDMYHLGSLLSSLRQQGIALIGSGSITHNLRDLNFETTSEAEYATRFESWVREHLQANDQQALINADKLSKDFKQAHPTNEHYLPLLFALGASQNEDKLDVLSAGIYFHSLSMESYFWSHD